MPSERKEELKSFVCHLMNRKYNMIDTHSHLFVEEFDEDLPAVIERARDSGVSKVFMPNIDDTTVEAMLNVCTAYKGYCFL